MYHFINYYRQYHYVLSNESITTIYFVLLYLKKRHILVLGSTKAYFLDSVYL